MVITMECLRALDEVSINVVITDPEGMSDKAVLFMMSRGDLGWLHFDAGRPQLRLRVPSVGLRGGTYRVKLSVSQGEMHDILDARDDIKLVVCDGGLAANCLYFQPRDWKVAGGQVIGSLQAMETPVLEAIEEF
jgi:hypothetical protein